MVVWREHCFCQGCLPIRYRRKVAFRVELQKEEYIKQRVLCLSAFIGVVFGMSTIGAQGQIIGQLEANIPFTFHAGGAKLPPGKYTIHVLDNTDLTQTPFIPHNFGR
jgi:hypothetical protein